MSSKSGSAKPPQASAAAGEGDPYVIVFDGGALGNPGKGYGSFLLTSPTGKQVHHQLDYSAENPRMTNNQAEYRTLIEALTHLRELLGDRASTASVRVEGDSQLVLFQLNGSWKVKNTGLQPLHAQARQLIAGFRDVTFSWHPRARSVAILGH